MPAGTTPPALPLADIQGFVLRGYRSFIYGRHFVTAVSTPASARTLIGALAGGPGALRITTAAKWQVKPDYTLNVGFTYEGLQALGVSAATLADFPPEFQSGAVGEAANIFDVGSSGPSYWAGGMGTSSNVHVIFSLFATTPESLEQHSAVLRKAFAGAVCETYSHDGKALPEGRVHFGYRDGISQPSLVDGPPPSHRYPDELGINGRSPWGDFILGYPNTFNNGSIYSPALAATPLGANASFGAFRILKQEVAAFFDYLKQAGAAVNLTPEQIAAKLLGRWSNGVPLALSPDSDAPIPEDRLNLFLYDSLATGQTNTDRFGTACPIGAHIRRGNPRDEIVQGGFTQQARIIRRNLPYGAAFDPDHPDDGIERGLVGYFINADFANQFQFLMSTWLNSSGFAGGQITGADALLGDNDPASSAFWIPTSNKTHLTLPGFARFVITRGSAYCFLPGMTGLGCIASQSC